MTSHEWLNSISAVALSGGLSVGAAIAATPILVTTTADSGPGSLRAALDMAAGDPAARQIVIVAEGDVAIGSTLKYDGQSGVAIHGCGQTVVIGVNETVLAIGQGANLLVRDLSFAGPGGFDINHRGDSNGHTAGKGIFVDVRADQTGSVLLTLSNVTVSDVAGHGVHVSDCTLADVCGGGGGGAGEGSDATIAVQLDNVTIQDVGKGGYDADGLRVDERGPGDIILVSAGSQFVGVGADGVELDEGQAGSVYVTDTGSRFIDNGGYCDADVLRVFLPAVTEAKFDDGQMAVTDIPAPVSGSPDDLCIEREVDLYASGSVEAYEFALDPDDGIDLDEAGRGSLEVLMIGSEISGNLDQGADFDEAGAGDIVASFVRSMAERNIVDGIKLSEEDDGGITGLMQGVVAKSNGGKGIAVVEEDDGDLTVLVRDTTTADNDDGIEVEQEDDGEGGLIVESSDIADGIDTDGVTVTQ